ncbi:MAG: hypothetical protein AAF191_18220, partial [Verrucomicrobiota bacterium]
RHDYHLHTLYDYQNTSSPDYYLTRYETSSGSEQMKIRNEIVYEWIAITDEHFYNQQISQRRTTLASKGTGIGLSVGSSIVGGDTGQILSGLSAIAQTGNEFIHQELLRSNALTAIGLELERERETVYKGIIEKLKLSTTKYPLGVAERDVLRYWKAGSPTFALHNLVEEASVEASKTKKKVEALENEKSSLRTPPPPLSESTPAETER